MKRICEGCKLPSSPQNGPALRHSDTTSGMSGTYHHQCWGERIRKHVESIRGPRIDEASIMAVLRASALVELLQEAQKERQSLAAYRRVLKALRVLGLDPETHGQRVLQRLEYHDNYGEPYVWLAKKLQEKRK